MIRLSALGAVVDVDLSPSTLDPDEFRRLWARCLTPDAAAGEPIAADGADSFATLTQSVTRGLISQRRGQLIMLHAGAVAHPETGRALVYVAPGGGRASRR